MCQQDFGFKFAKPDVATYLSSRLVKPVQLFRLARPRTWSTPRHSRCEPERKN